MDMRSLDYETASEASLDEVTGFLPLLHVPSVHGASEDVMPPLEPVTPTIEDPSTRQATPPTPEVIASRPTSPRPLPLVPVYAMPDDADSTINGEKFYFTTPSLHKVPNTFRRPLNPSDRLDQITYFCIQQNPIFKNLWLLINAISSKNLS